MARDSPGGIAQRFNYLDALGSVVAVSIAAGTVDRKLAYTVYGVADANTGAAMRYKGRRLDATTGLSYLRARDYAPLLGRFLQADPIGIEGGINLYAYVYNDPLNLTDPLGTVPPLVVAALWWGAGGAIIGGGVDAVIQGARTGSVDLSQVGVAAAGGAITGAGGAAAAGLGTAAARVFVNAAVGAGAGAGQTLRGTDDSLVRSALLGAAFGAAGALAAEAVAASFARANRAAFNALPLDLRLIDLHFDQTNSSILSNVTPAGTIISGILSNLIGSLTGIIPQGFPQNLIGDPNASELSGQTGSEARK